MKWNSSRIFTASTAAVFALALGISGALADEPGYGKDGYGKEGHGGGGYGMMGGHGMGMLHSSTGHLIRHLLKHEKDIGLTADQVTKLKDMQLNLDKTRIKSEADIQIAERELKALIEDEKSDLGAIEAKLKQSESLQTGLRMTSIKARREVLALLTPEQRAKEKAEHEKMMQQHRGGESGKANPHGGMMPNPHGGAMPGNPAKGDDTMPPASPGSMRAQ
jgi:protein CpxP